MLKLNCRWRTVATVAFTHAVSNREYNPLAHGGVCHLQARRAPNGVEFGRRVNTNGRHKEIGPAFRLDAATRAEWESIAKDCAQWGDDT